MHKNYYEAIIQVRPRTAEIEKFIEKSLRNTDKASLSKRKILKEGIDYYISSWKYAGSLGNLLVKRFGGSVVVSKKIFGKSQGKVVYRSSVLYRPHPFNRGDVLVCDEQIFSITSIGKIVVGKNLVSGKKVRIDKKSWELLEKHTTTVSRTFPSLEVINPEDYQSILVQNPKKNVSHKVSVVVYKGKAYLVD